MINPNPLIVLFLIIMWLVFSMGVEIVMPLPSSPVLSSAITTISIFVTLVSTVIGVLAYIYRSKLLRMVHILSFLGLMFFLWSLRAWITLFDNSLFVLFLLSTGLVLIGMLPIVNKEWSEYFYREQIYPQTKGGKLFRWVSAWVIIIGAFIARAGWYIVENGERIMSPRLAWFLAGTMYLASVWFTFFAIHDYMFFEPDWKEWSWKWKRKSKKRVENKGNKLP